MNLIDDDLDNLIHQIANYYQQLQHSDTLLETANQTALESTIQNAKNRLTETEETLVLLIRTYLQRVSSKLSATEFVELTKAAVVLIDKDQSSLSFPESKRLLYIALKTFGAQLSQPIPALGERIPKRIVNLLARLAQYQKIIRTDGLETVLMMLATQTIENTAKRLSPDMIRTMLENSTTAPEIATQEGLDDLARVLCFKLQLQMPFPRATKSEQEIAEQLNHAIAEFKTRYQSLTDVTQPKWDNDLSVSSPFFTGSNFETASNDSTWLPPTIDDKTSKDETNS